MDLIDAPLIKTRSGKHFAYNVAFNILSLAAPLLFAFVATPILVRGLGIEDYGYYSIVLAVIGFAFTTGIARTPAKYIPEKLSDDRNGELRSLLSAAVVITLAVALIEGLGLALVSPFLTSQVMGVTGEAGTQLNIAIYIACLAGTVAMVSQLFQSTLQGIHRFRVYALVTVGASLLLNLGSALLAANGFPYRDIVLLNFAVTAAAAVTFFVFAKAGVPELGLELRIATPALRKVGRFAASIFVYQTVTSIFYLFERSYVLRNFGPEELAYYTIPLMLGIYLHGVILAVSQVTVPKFNERLNDIKSLTAIYITLTKIVAAASVFLALFYYLLGAEILYLWLGTDFAARSFHLLVIDGISFSLIAMLIPAWIISEAAQRPGINASSPLVTYLVGMVAIVLLGAVYGIEGAAAGRLVGAMAALPIIAIVERMVFRQIFWKEWTAIASRILAAACLMSLVALLLDTFHYVSWPGFIVKSCVLVLGFWGTLIVLRYTDRAELRAAFSQPAPESDDSEMLMPMQ